MGDILDFINKNAGAFQALAAFLSLIVTIVLVKITADYVKLTRNLASAAQAGLDKEKESILNRKRQLLGILKQLRAITVYLPSEAKDGEKIRQAALWEPDALSNLQELASEVGTLEGQRAALIVTALQWIKERVDEVKKSHPRVGYDWGLFPWERWRKEIKCSTEGLNELWSQIADLLSVPPNSRIHTDVASPRQRQ